jgi:fatty acid desaturase
MTAGRPHAKYQQWVDVLAAAQGLPAAALLLALFSGYAVPRFLLVAWMIIGLPLLLAALLVEHRQVRAAQAAARRQADPDQTPGLTEPPVNGTKADAG